MSGLNELIAASGERFYENARKGWIERPEEARQRSLQELQMEQARLGVMRGSAELDEYQQGADLRNLQRQEETRKAQPEYIAGQEQAAAEKRKLEMDALEQALVKSRQEVSTAKSADERLAKADKATEYSNIVLGAVSQTSTYAAVQYIAANKQALLDAGSPEEDDTIKAILSASREEQARLIDMLKRGQPSIQKHLQELELVKAREKASSAGGTVGTDKLTSAIMQKQISNEQAGLPKNADLTDTEIKLARRQETKDALKLAFESRRFLTAKTVPEKAAILREAVEAMDMSSEELAIQVQEIKKDLPTEEKSAISDAHKHVKESLFSTKIDVPAGAIPVATDASGKEVYEVGGKYVYKDGTVWSK